MKNQINILGILWLFYFRIGSLLAQPTPGDYGLNGGGGGIVGGGADLGISFWIWLIFAVLYFAFKWRKQIFSLCKKTLISLHSS